MRSLLGTLVNRAPVAYTSSGGVTVMPFSGRTGRETEMRTMGTVGTLFAIVHRLSNATSQVEWKLWRKAKSGKPEDRVEVTSHAALDLWNAPNLFMPRQEFVEISQQHIDLTGEAWWIVARDPRSPVPLELWPVRPDRMEPVPDPVEYLAGYIYTDPDGRKHMLHRDDVIMLRMPNPLDPYRGMGPVQSILVDLDATRYTAEWNRNFFLNSAEPGGIIEIDKRLSDPEFNEHRDRWRQQHQGVANAHRVALLEGGAKWVDRKYTQRDMQFKDLRDLSRDVIREAFGMPKFAVGDVDDVNRATAEASAAWFASFLVGPRLQRIKAALNSEFLPLYGPSTVGMEFDYEDPVPENQEQENATMVARATAAKLLHDAGYDLTAICDAVGLPEMAIAPAPAPSALPAGPDQPALPPGPPPPSRRGAPAGLSNADERKKQDWEHRIDALLSDWQDVRATQFEAVVSQVRSIVASGAPADLAALTVPTDDAEALLTDAMYAQATAGAKRMADAAAKAGKSISPVVPVEPTTDRLVNAVPNPFKVAAGLAADLAAAAKVTVTNLASGLASYVSTEALRFWNPGATPDEVAEQVAGQLDSLTDRQLELQLGAAVWAAENEGRFATLEQAEEDGVGASAYTASEINDQNTCGPCGSVDGREYTSLAAAQADYPFGGYRDCDGRDRCRGTIEPSWS